VEEEEMTTQVETSGPRNAAQRAVLAFQQLDEQVKRPPGGGQRQIALTGTLLLAAGMSALMVALLAGIKAGLRVLDTGISAEGLPLMMVNLTTIAMAYAFGWVTVALSARVYRLPLAGAATRAFGWVFLFCLLALYLFITLKLFEQHYTATKLLAYWFIMALGVLGLTGVHLITGTGNMRGYAFFLMLVTLLHLGVIVYHYNFIDEFEPGGLIPDMLFFLNMLLVEVLMFAHLGVLRPLRDLLDREFIDVRARMGVGIPQS
jgi:hypothetical protein